MFHRFLATLALTALPALLPANPEAIRVEKAVAYGKVGAEKLLFDIATPPGEGPFPCVVFLHGGAWQAGSRKDLSMPDKAEDGTLTPSLIEQAAARGYVAVSVGYRL